MTPLKCNMVMAWRGDLSHFLNQYWWCVIENRIKQGWLQKKDKSWNSSILFNLNQCCQLIDGPKKTLFHVCRSSFRPTTSFSLGWCTLVPTWNRCTLRSLPMTSLTSTLRICLSSTATPCPLAIWSSWSCPGSVWLISVISYPGPRIWKGSR